MLGYAAKRFRHRRHRQGHLWPDSIREMTPATWNAAADDWQSATTVLALLQEATSRAPDNKAILFCSIRLAKYKVPLLIKIAETIPQTAIGKIDKRALRGRP